MAVVFVDSDSNATSCYITGSAWAFRKCFWIMKITYTGSIRLVLSARWWKYLIFAGTTTWVAEPIRVKRDSVVRTTNKPNLVLAPARHPSRNWKVIYNAWTIFACSENISHPGLVNIKSAQLRYLSIVLLSLVEFNMMGCTFDMPLKCLTLLWLWRRPLRNLLHLRRQCLMLHTRTSRNLLVRWKFCRAEAMFIAVWGLWHGKLSLPTEWALLLSIARLIEGWHCIGKVTVWAVLAHVLVSRGLVWWTIKKWLTIYRPTLL